MPTRKQIARMHLAEFRLHNGAPPDHQHQDRMVTDPAYRAAHEGTNKHNLAATRNGGRPVGQIYLTYTKNQVIIFDNEMKLAILDDNQRLAGIARYDPKKWRETFEPFPTKQ